MINITIRIIIIIIIVAIIIIITFDNINITKEQSSYARPYDYKTIKFKRTSHVFCLFASFLLVLLFFLFLHPFFSFFYTLHHIGWIVQQGSSCTVRFIIIIFDMRCAHK